MYLIYIYLFLCWQCRGDEDVLHGILHGELDKCNHYANASFLAAAADLYPVLENISAKDMTTEVCNCFLFSCFYFIFIQGTIVDTFYFVSFTANNCLFNEYIQLI